MLETGQPLHAFDRSKLTGPIGVRRALPGETLTTLDDVKRTLDPDDLVVTDDTGAIALAGVMGGASTEIDGATSEVLLEAAHWDPASILRAVRRHKLPSEAGKRFERGVDPRIAGVALARCVELLVEHGGAFAAPGYTVVGDVPLPRPIRLPAGLPGRLAGMPIAADAAVQRLEQVGCTVSPDADAGSDRADEVLVVTPPTWRSDLTDPADLVEEVVRLEGYDHIPSTLPSAPPGRGLTEAQKLRRAVSRAVAAAGYTEVLDHPVRADAASTTSWAGPLTIRATGPWSWSIRSPTPSPNCARPCFPVCWPRWCATPDEGCATSACSRSAGSSSTATDDRPHPPWASSIARPTTRSLLRTPHCPTSPAIWLRSRRVPVSARAGGATRSRSAGPMSSSWAGAVGRQFRVELDVVAAQTAPWHPGRCAALVLDGRVVGHAGELHPRVIASLDLPERTVAVELDLDAFEVPPPARTPSVSGYPPVLLDLALVVPSAVPAAEVLAAVRDGAGELLESVRIFDVYRDAERLGPIRHRWRSRSDSARRIAR